MLLGMRPEPQANEDDAEESSDAFFGCHPRPLGLCPYPQCKEMGIIMPGEYSSRVRT